jgi:hypothetical protein
MSTLKSLEKKMWENYYAQEKLIKERSKIKYGDPEIRNLTNIINDLISKRKVLDAKWNKLNKAKINKEKMKFGIEAGDRVQTISIGLFMGAGNIVRGTAVMYRGVLKVKLDDPDEYNKKYAPLTKDWRKIA